MVFVPLGALGGQIVGHLLEEAQGVGLVDLVALGRGDAVLDPLPELAAGDFGRGGVLPASVETKVSAVSLDGSLGESDEGPEMTRLFSSILLCFRSSRYSERGGEGGGDGISQTHMR